MSSAARPAGGWSGTFALLACACLLAVLPARAAAVGASTYDPLASGKTKIAFEGAFLATLKRNGVKLGATSPTKASGGALSLPVTAGEFDPTIEKGTIEHEGGTTFTRGKRKVVLREVMLKIKPAPLYAKVGGGQLKLAGNAKTKVVREGFGAEFTATRLRLTQKFATRLNKKLGLYRTKPFHPGMPLARITSTFQPASVNVLPQNRVTIVPDPAIVAKLHELHVSLNPVAPTELAAGPLFTSPIAVASRLSPDGRSGILYTEGAIEYLQLGAGQVFWKAPLFEPAPATSTAEVEVLPTPAFPGKLGPIQITTYDLSSATISSEPKARTISVSGAQLTLSAQSAATFEEAFSKPQEKSGVFHAGELFGSVSFTALGQ
jgi:hypothetical protein